MARDARWVIKSTFENLRKRNAGSPEILKTVDLIEADLNWALDLAGVRQTPGPRAAKTPKAADGKKD
jgi:hypothetical protein